MRSLKIAIASFTFLPERNGVANMALLQAKTLLSLGHKVEVITGLSSEPCDDRQLEPIKIKRYAISGNGSLLHPVRGSGIRQLHEELFLNNYDIIFVHGWQTWCIDVITRSNSTASIVLISHGISVNTCYDFKSLITCLSWIPYKIFSIPRIFSRISAIAFLSAQKDDDRFYDAKYAPENLKKFIIPNPHHYKINTESNSKKIKHTETLKILSVGAYSSSKNEKELINALRKTKNSCHVNLVGYKNNDYLTSLKKLCAKNNKHFSKHNIQIEFHTNKTEAEIDKLYHDADLFVSTSRTECFPLVNIQAMANGIPFISSDVGCLRSIPGGITYKSTKQLVNLLNQLNDPVFCDHLDQHGKNGLQFAANELSHTNYIKNQTELLQWLVDFRLAKKN